MTLRARLFPSVDPHPSLPEPAPVVPGLPIAIVGMGCRFPQAPTLEAYWHLIHDGRDAITEVPDDRWTVHPGDAPPSTRPGTGMSRWGGFLEEVDRFDASFFGIVPRDARRMDPQHRLVLEVAWDTFEQAGMPVDTLYGSRTGVFIGMMHSEYAWMGESRLEDLSVYTHTGGLQSGAAGRVSHAFGLRGPSLSLNTAASSSLAAVHLATQSLRSGESVCALAGGVNLCLLPHQTIAFSHSQMMAGDGRCKFCDARADGFVRSEGVGLVVLKLLSRALTDGDTVYAVIRGSAINNDGGYDALFMTPNQAGQEAVLRRAYQDAGIDPSQVQYVEAHGTGTRIGDATEVRALAQVVGAGRSPAQPCRIGSVKTNIGHTEAAAGIAGLLKVVLVLQHGIIPPSLHLKVPTPEIAWQEIAITVPTTAEAWTTPTGKRLAGVSAFGITGTNVHLVLEGMDRRGVAALSPPSPSACLLPLSAHEHRALAALIAQYRRYLATGDEETGPSLYEIAHTAAVRRTHQELRVSVTGTSRAEWIQQLDTLLAGKGDRGEPPARRGRSAAPRLLFVFSGQGSQWQGMGRTLLQTEPVYRAVLEACDAAIAHYSGWSLLDELMAPPARARLEQVEVIQPLIFATQVALAALWQSWGIVPHAVLGHSMGEIAAACVAGALSIKDAAHIVCKRSEFVKGTSGQGGMVVVGLSVTDCEAWVDPFRAQVAIAVSNSPATTVLSGDLTVLRHLVARLESAHIFCRWVNVDYASHSPQMDQFQATLRAELADLTPRATTIPMYSTVTTQPVAGGELNAAYWVRNLRDPVLFFQTLAPLLQADACDLLEISPHPILISALQQGFHSIGKAGLTLPSLKRGMAERVTLLETLGTLYRHGYAVAWHTLYPTRVPSVPLPPYPWQRQRYWFTDEETLTAETSTTPATAVASSMPTPLTVERVQRQVPSDRQALVEDYLLEVVTFLLGLPATPFSVHQSLASIGMDSLMGLVLKQHIEDALPIQLPPADQVAGATITQLAHQVVTHLSGMTEK